jgi:hydroxymethylglutaryl-CoA lyase
VNVNGDKSSQTRVLLLINKDGFKIRLKSVLLNSTCRLLTCLQTCLFSSPPFHCQGVPVVETTSFVSPKWVPQLADAAEVLGRIRRQGSTRYPVLAPNMKGAENALAAGAKEIAIFTAASEAFNQKNLNCTVEESLRKFDDVVALAKKENVDVRGYVSCVVGCPIQGHVAPQDAARVAQALDQMGCYEVSLGDTIGVGTPGKISNFQLLILSRDVYVDLIIINLLSTCLLFSSF